MKYRVKIVDNLSEKNHYSHINNAFAKATDVTIASPFLDDIIESMNLDNISSVKLITTLRSNSMDGLIKAKTLISIVKELHRREIHCEICIDAKLHGKVYIFKTNGKYERGFVTSANFTIAGLKHNHEWGFEVTDDRLLKRLEQRIAKSGDIVTLGEQAIEEIEKEVKKHEKQLKKRRNDVECNFDRIIRKSDQRVFLKLIGSNDDRVTKNDVYNDSTTKTVHFAIALTRVRPGDILILYGVGTSCILSICEVTSSFCQMTKAELRQNGSMKRWPYYVKVKVLTNSFGENWYKLSVKANEVCRDFNNRFPNENVTLNGRNLGAINFGGGTGGAIRLSKAFAEFVMEKVYSLDDRQ